MAGMVLIRVASIGRGDQGCYQYAPIRVHILLFLQLQSRQPTKETLVPPLTPILSGTIRCITFICNMNTTILNIFLTMNTCSASTCMKCHVLQKSIFRFIPQEANITCILKLPDVEFPEIKIKNVLCVMTLALDKCCFIPRIILRYIQFVNDSDQTSRIFSKCLEFALGEFILLPTGESNFSRVSTTGQNVIDA